MDNIFVKLRRRRRGVGGAPGGMPGGGMPGGMPDMGAAGMPDMGGAAPSGGAGPKIEEVD